MTDWLMVIITAIYVVATIIICYFNGKSAKAAKKYKEETLKFKETLDLRSLLNQFMLESQNYQNRTRKIWAE